MSLEKQRGEAGSPDRRKEADEEKRDRVGDGVVERETEMEMGGWRETAVTTPTPTGSLASRAGREHREKLPQEVVSLF